MSERDIAIVGMACVFPKAPNLQSYWHNIVNAVDAIEPLPQDRWPGSRNTVLPRDHFAHVSFTRGGFIPTPFLFDPLRFKIMPKVVKTGDIDQFILLHVMAEALEDAGIGVGHKLRARTDVIVGRGGYTSNKMMDIFLRADLIDRLQTYLDGKMNPSQIEELVAGMLACLPEPDADSMASSIPNFVASRSANRLNLQGTAYTVDAACASSLIAVEQVVRRLREGLCDVGLAGGINFTQVPSFWYLFDKVLAVSPSGVIRPFDARADGLLIGEGAGVVVLKRLEDARQARDRVYAIIKGVGSASDGNATGILAPSSLGQVRALEQAHADGGIDPNTIQLLEAHGTGTVQGDAAELETIRRFYGESRSPYPTRALGTVKSMIGHTMPAAGIAAVIKTAMAIKNQILPPSLHCDQPNPALEGTEFFVNTLARPWIRDPASPPRQAGINAFGFGGINAHTILSEVEPLCKTAVAVDHDLSAGEPNGILHARPPLPDLHRPSELLVFSGDNPPKLAAKMRRVCDFLEHDRQAFSLEDLSFSLVGEVDFSQRCKLAIIEDELGNLLNKLQRLASELEAGSLQADESKGFYYSADAAEPSGKVVALFPGQGFPGLIGEYPEHLLAFCMHFPRTRPVFDMVEHRDKDPGDPLPTSYLLVPPTHLANDDRNRLQTRFGTLAPLAQAREDKPIQGPDQRRLSAMGMLVSNWVSWLILKPFNIPFSIACGQSLGDISALCAAGMVDFDQVIPRLWRYLSIDDRLPGTGCMAFVGASEETLAPLLKEVKQAWIAIHLSPETQIIGGSDEAIEQVIKALKSRNAMAQKLPFPPIHTPRLAGLRERLRGMEGEPMPLRPSNLTIYSTATESPLPKNVEELRELVSGNITQPVRYWQTVHRIYEDGGRIFIQVGTGTLAGNIKTIRPESDAVAVALDVDFRHPITQLQHLCATLFTQGVRFNLEPLFEARQPHGLPLDSPRPKEELSKSLIPLTLYWPPLQNPEKRTSTVEETNASNGLQKSRTDKSDRGDAMGPTWRAELDDQTGRSAMDQKSDRLAPLPLLGKIKQLEAGKRIETECTFDLDEDLFLADHCFINPDGIKPLCECFPLLPLTMTLEVMAEASACLAPGLGLISIENIRANQWIALDGVQRTTVRVESVVQSIQDGIVRIRSEVLLGDKSTATGYFNFAEKYRLTVHLQFSELGNERAYPIAVERLYTDRYYFHGPRFQCMRSVDRLGDRGIVGELQVPTRRDFFASVSTPQLILDPVTLDGAGQMLGAIFYGEDVYMLPVSIEKIEFYQPAPAPGTRVPIRVDVREYDRDARRISGNMEVQDGHGNVWFRILAWQDILFRWPREMLDVLRLPKEHTLAREAVVSSAENGTLHVVLRRQLFRDAQLERLARLYLNAGEWPEFEKVESSYKKQREWLMGRIAAKDAVRLWLARQTGQDLLHPAALTLVPDQSSRQFTAKAAGYQMAPSVSVANVGDDVTAIAAAEDAIVRFASSAEGAGP